jgi:hypothetical protein
VAKGASANEGGTFLELIDFFETGSGICRSFCHKRRQLAENNREFVRKADPYSVFSISCNGRNVFDAAASTLITALMGE